MQTNCMFFVSKSQIMVIKKSKWVSVFTSYFTYFYSLSRHLCLFLLNGRGRISIFAPSLKLYGYTLYVLKQLKNMNRAKASSDL